MVSSPNISPARRRSIAVLNMSDSNSKSGRRRAYSTAPGDKLSPLSKSRRSLKPRKSILKRPSVAPEDVTQPMYFTTIQHRVSFAEKSQVRLYDKDHRNSEGSVLSSPEQDPEQDSDQPSPIFSNENAYPGANKSHPRRGSSSFGTDINGGEESMELDTTKIIVLTDELKLTDEGWNGSDQEPSYGEGDMDMTEIVRRQSVALRRRSSMHRQSLAPPEETAQDKSVSEIRESKGGRSHTDFTAPLGQSLQKPEPPPDEWHALRAVTRARADDSVLEDGETEFNELDNAISRLMVARDSLGLSGDCLPGGDSSFASTESDSFTQGHPGFLDADRKMNITGMLRRASSGTFTNPSQDTNEPIKLPVALPLENPKSPFTQPDRLEISASVSTKPPPVFKKSTPTQPSQPVPEPPTTETPRAAPSSSGGVFKPPPLEERSFFSLQKPPARLNASTTAATTITNARPRKRLIIETEKPLEERPTPRKRPAISHPTAPSTLRTSSAPPEASPPKGTVPTSSSPGKKARPISSLRKPSFPVPSRSSSVPGLRGTSSPFTHGRKPDTNELKALAFSRRVPAPVQRRKSASGYLPGPSKKTSLFPHQEKPISQRPAPASIQEPRAEGDTGRGGEAPDPAPSPSPLLRSQSPVTFAEEDAQGSDEERSGIEITPPKDDGATGRWRHEVIVPGSPESAQDNHISIEQFLAMTGTEFMENLVVPRSSSIHPSLLASSSTTSNSQEIALADYVVATFVDLPHWILYDEVSKDLQKRIDAFGEFHRKAEEDIKKDIPDLFREFVESDDSFKEALIPHLNLLKVSEKAQVRAQWYDWKFHWANELLVTAEAGFNQLAVDATFLERVNREGRDLLATLRQEYEGVVAELKKDEKEVAEIESCNQEYLNELKTSLAEQSGELDIYRAEVSEAMAKLERLNMRSAELDEDLKEAQDGITECEKIIQIQNNSTKEEVFRLKDKLEWIQDLHMWKATKVNAEMAQFLYAGRFSVSIPCVNLVPIASRVTIDRIPQPKKRWDPFPSLSDLTLEAAVKWVRGMGGSATIREIVAFVSDYWTSIVQLRAQLNIIETKYSIEIEVIPQDGTTDDPNASAFSTSAVLPTIPSFKTVIKPVDRAVGSKVIIYFLFDFGVFAHWPMALKRTKCEVEVLMGPFDAENIRASVMEYLSQVTEEKQHGYLLDAIDTALQRSRSSLQS